MGAQRASRMSSPADIDATVVALTDRVTRRLRAAGRVGRTVVLRMRFADFTRATRSHTLPQPTSDTHEILAALRTLVDKAMPLIDSQGLTLIGISVGNLDNADSVQLMLPFDEGVNAALDSVLDTVHDRFGSKAVTLAVLLHRDPGIEVPLLPE